MFITQGKTNWKYILILVILAVIVGGGILWWTNRLEKSFVRTPTIIEKEEGYKILDEMSFWEENSVKEYKIGTADFKIYPPNKESYQFGYFEAYNNGEKIFSSEPVYQISDLLSFEYKNNKYIIVSDYSGGAHCCFLEYIFILDKDNNLKLIKNIPAGNTHISGNNLILKEKKLYIVNSDDRFAYFYTAYAGSYFFQRYFRINEDDLIESNLDFKDKYLKEAEDCEKDLNEKLQTEEGYELLFPELTCKVINYLIAGENQKAWDKFEEYFNEIAVKDEYFGFELRGKDSGAVKKEIIEKMKEFIKDETADWQTYRNEEYGFEFKYPILFRIVKAEDYWSSEFCSFGGCKDTILFLAEGYSCISSITVYERSIGEEEKIIDFNYSKPGNYLESKKEISINNYKGIEYRLGEEEGGPTAIFVLLPYNSKTYSLGSCEEGSLEEIFNQMLSTFRFSPH